MSNENIFSEENEVKSNWIKLVEVGEEFQGTLVDSRKTIDAYGKEQTIYEFLTDEGEFRPFGSKLAVDAQMKHVKVGQIVGLKFIEERPAKTAGYKPTKIIKVFASPNIVNKEWLEAKEAEDVEKGPEQSLEEVAETMPDAEVPVPSVTTPAAPVNAVVGDAIAQINELAKTKLLVMDVALVKKAIQEVTGLAFIESNYAKIIEHLTAMPNKTA